MSGEPLEDLIGVVVGGIDAIAVDLIVALEGRGEPLPTVIVRCFCVCASLVDEDKWHLKGIFGVYFLNKTMLTFLASNCPTIIDSLSASTLVISPIGTSVYSY